MKESIYNVIVKNKNLALIYNTLSNSFISLDSSFVKQNRINLDILPNDLRKVLYENGIVVDDDIEEYESLKFVNNRSNYSNRSISYTILPTLDCNAHCHYCFQNLKKEYMSEECQDRVVELMRFDHKVKNNEVIYIAFFGGEPLLDKSFEVIKTLCTKIRAAFREELVSDKLKINLSIITNGTEINKEKLNFLVKNSLKSIQITFDGDKEYHDKIKGKGFFDKTIKSLHLLKEYKIKPTLRINTLRENIDSIKSLIRYLGENGIAEFCGIYFSPVTNINELVKVKNDNFLSTKEFSKIEIEFIKLALKNKFSFSIPKTNISLCTASFPSDKVIGPDGRLYKCYNGIYEKEDYGSIIDEKMRNMRSFFKYVNYSPFDDKACQNCLVFPICKGGCPYERIRGNKECLSYKYNLKEIITQIYEHSQIS